MSKKRAPTARSPAYLETAQFISSMLAVVSTTHTSNSAGTARTPKYIRGSFLT